MSTGWRDPAKAAEYLDRVGRLAPRLAGEEVLVEVVPPASERVIDLGCGDGRLTALVLENFPTVRAAVAVDRSPPMLARAKEHFASDPRVDVRAHDLTEPIDGLGTADVVVSGFALHHLEDERKRSLFGEVATQLRPGGVFANLEVVRSATAELHATFRAAIGREADDPEDRLSPVEDQLAWMRDAGLQQVDCLWRWRGFALLVGSA
jgi:tRNA (cmo5U34)-methyltransferase